MRPPRFARLDEAVGSHADTQDACELLHALRRSRRRGKDDHVDLGRLDAAFVGILVAHADLVAGGLDSGRASAHKARALIARPVVERVESLAVGAHVHVEDGDIFDAVVDGLKRFLDGVHATEARAVLVETHVARADAEDEQDAVRVLAVGRLDDLAARGASGREQALELHGGQYVGVLPVAELLQQRWLDQVEAGGNDRRPDLSFEDGSRGCMKSMTLGRQASGSGRRAGSSAGRSGNAPGR